MATCLPQREILRHTLLSLKVDLVLGGLLEDLGPILAVLGVMVSTN